MDELTIAEIANILSINQKAASTRLRRAGIKPMRLVGTTGIYDPSAVDAIRDVPGKGRPKKDKPE
jgi:hypothetical protein